eukprot:188534_1
MLNAADPSWLKNGREKSDKDKNRDNEEKQNDNSMCNSDPEPFFVANLSEFNNVDRKVIHVPEIDKTGKANDRPILILKALNTFYALDLRCYHAGGPLSLGDIEDVEGNLCIKCPWHRYIIKLETGEGLYYGYDPVKKQKTGLTSKGKKQRKHTVIVNKQTKKMYIVLNNDAKELGSDQYAKKLNDVDEGPTIHLGGKSGSKSKGIF